MLCMSHMHVHPNMHVTSKYLPAHDVTLHRCCALTSLPSRRVVALQLEQALTNSVPTISSTSAQVKMHECCPHRLTSPSWEHVLAIPQSARQQTWHHRETLRNEGSQLWSDLKDNLGGHRH